MARGKNLGPWFRTYASFLDDAKLEQLSDSTFRVWIKLLAVATLCGGIIPGDISTLCIKLRRPAGKIRDTLQVLLSAGLIEPCGNGYTPHNWETRQFESDVSTDRVKRFRKAQRNVSETPPEAESEADTETKKEVVARKRASPKISLPDDFPDALSLEEANEYWQIQGRTDLCDRTADEAAQFRDHHSKNGTKFLDWPAAWRTWARNAIKFNRSPKHGPNQDNFAAAAAELITESRQRRAG